MILNLVYASVNVFMYVVPPPPTYSYYIRSQLSSMNQFVSHVTRAFGIRGLSTFISISK